MSRFIAISQFIFFVKSLIIGVEGVMIVEKQLDYYALGARIRKARENKKLTQEQLSEICSLSTSHIGHIERGTRIPSLETLFKICTSLEISMDYLLFDSFDSDEIHFANISAILKTKSKEKINTFMSTVKILADKIDEL